jgi:nucleotidyltransferase/DNA polymerase involved in DNA repair
MKTRKIIHLDLDAFFCAVEELHRPELRGKAFAVGGQASQRGVISSCSYPARQKGVHSAMPTAQAHALVSGVDRFILIIWRLSRRIGSCDGYPCQPYAFAGADIDR